MTIAIKTCPHCGARWSEPYTKGVGEPFYPCSGCGQMIVDTDFNEWEARTVWGKASMWVTWFYTTCLYGSVPLLCTGIFMGEDVAAAHAKELFIGGVVVAGTLVGRTNWTDIQSSRRRMKDPRYREALIQAGAMKAERKSA